MHTILRLPQVKIRVGLSRSSIYLAVSQRKFPRPVSLGARAVGWLESEVDAWLRLCVIVVRHTFGGRLNFHPHLHIMVSAGGLKLAEARWVESLQFDRTQIMELWRFGSRSRPSGST